MRRWSSVNCAGVTEVVGFGFVIIFFNVMRHIAEDMTDPYGNNATDCNRPSSNLDPRTNLQIR